MNREMKTKERRIKGVFALVFEERDLKETLGTHTRLR